MGNPFIQQLMQRLIDAAIDGETALCISIASKSDSSRWIQMTWDHLNCAFPLSEDASVLPQGFGIQVPSEWAQVGFEPNTYITWEHGSDAGEVAEFADAYLKLVLRVTPDELNTTVTEEFL